MSRPLFPSEIDQIKVWKIDMPDRHQAPTPTIATCQSEILISPFHFPVSAVEAKEQLELIRLAFGLTIKDLADVLRIEQQTVYAWSCGENAPNEQNGNRIRKIKFYADKWNALSRFSAKKGVRLDLNGTTLLEELSRETIDDQRIWAVMQAASLVIGKIPSLAEQEILEKGLDPAQYCVADWEFDAETGKTHFSLEDSE